MSRFSLLACALVPFPILIGAAASLVHERESDVVSVGIEQPGKAPYPFQAIRMRLHVSNTGMNEVGPLIQPEDRIRDPEVKSPWAESFRPGKVMILLRDPLEPTFCGPRPNLNTSLFLKAEHRVSISFPIAAEWTVEQDVAKKMTFMGKAFFRDPGSYAIRFYFPHGFTWNVGQVEREDYKEMLVQVKEPRGEDKAVMEILEKSGAVAAAMMSPVGKPPKELVPDLEDLVKKYPQSSYCDYARFALARIYFGGQLYEEMGYEEAVAAGIKQLEGIQAKDFPYRPGALVLLRKWLKPRDEMKAKKVEEILNSDHADALEWLAEISSSMDQNQWKAFRQRPISRK